MPYVPSLVKRVILLLVIGCAVSTAFPATAVHAQSHDTEPPGSVNTVGPADAGPVYLYFADTNDMFLTGEARAIERTDDPTLYCRRIIEGLIAGPGGSLIRTIPESTGVRAVFIDSNRTAYVDLTPSVVRDFPGGVRSELLTVYSIVNTLLLNVPGIDRVKILIRGNEADTLAGHIDIRHPLKAEMLLIR